MSKELLSEAEVDDTETVETQLRNMAAAQFTLLNKATSR